MPSKTIARSRLTSTISLRSIFRKGILRAIRRTRSTLPRASLCARKPRRCRFTRCRELCGSGMVHPNVLRAANVDPEEFTGFAFGLGIDRTCARIYQLDDIRLLFENDVRFLEQFR